MKTIILIFFIALPSWGAFNLGPDDTYGLIKDPKNGKVYVHYSLPLTVHVSLSQVYDKATDDADFRLVLEKLHQAVAWINSYLGVHAIDIKYNDSIPSENPHDGFTTFVYKPGTFRDPKTGQEYAGLCSSIANYGQPPFWKQYPGKRWNEIGDSTIYIHRFAEEDLFEPTVRHEILHALGFDHIKHGIMIEQFNFMTPKDVMDYIHPDQLMNWQKKTKNGFKWWGQGPTHIVLD